MFLLFVGLVGATFFVLLVWAGGMVYRLYNPERPGPIEPHPVVRREKVASEGQQAAVGAREIRADRRRERRRRAEAQEEYVLGLTEGIPESWQRNLWDRRN